MHMYGQCVVLGACNPVADFECGVLCTQLNLSRDERLGQYILNLLSSRTSC